MKKPEFQYIHESHLDLFWIGDYRYCLERGRHVIKDYIDRCLEYKDETFMLETVVFLEYFLWGRDGIAQFESVCRRSERQ